MVTLEQLKEFMRQRAEDDRNIRYVSVSAPTLEAALQSAAVELGVAVKRVEFDVVQKGTNGVMGFGRKPWTLTAYEAAKKGKLAAGGDESYLPDLDGVEMGFTASAPGGVFVRMWADGVFLKVTPPVGDGEPVVEEMALEALHARGVKDINRQIVRGAVKLQTGTYGRVAEWIPKCVPWCRSAPGVPAGPTRAARNWCIS